MLLLLLLSLARTHAQMWRRHIRWSFETHTLGGGDEPEGPFTIVAVSFVVVVVVDIRRGQTAKAAASDALSPDKKT